MSEEYLAFYYLILNQFDIFSLNTRDQIWYQKKTMKTSEVETVRSIMLPWRRYLLYSDAKISLFRNEESSQHLLFVKYSILRKIHSCRFSVMLTGNQICWKLTKDMSIQFPTQLGLPTYSDSFWGLGAPRRSCPWWIMIRQIVDSSFLQHVNRGIHSVGTEWILTELITENF